MMNAYGFECADINSNHDADALIRSATNMGLQCINRIDANCNGNFEMHLKGDYDIIKNWALANYDPYIDDADLDAMQID